MKLSSIQKAAAIFAALALISWLINKAFVFNAKSNEGEPSPIGRWEWDLMRLADPATGEIPENMRQRELQFAATLPVAAQRDSMSLNFQSMGPYNVGGRTRAFAIDINNPNVYLAGGVSGGMWRSTDAGATWNRVTAPNQHAATSCVSQDPRNGKTNIWYYGSGEVSGNSASKSFSAYYRGNGIYKSTDGGVSWSQLAATAAIPNKPSDWDAVFKVLVDPTRNDSDIVYAATKRGIQRSNDGGLTWKKVFGNNAASDFVDLIVTENGTFYTTFSTTGSGSYAGFWRSADGVSWSNITPTGFASVHELSIMYSPKMNQDLVYFFSGTPNAGANGISLWKYQYLNGDGTGAGGNWTNLNQGLLNVDINVYGGYCQVLAVKDDDPNVIFIGGTNLYRSTSGFQDTLHTTHVGGYKIEGNPDFTYRSGIHYPDQHTLTFHPYNPNILISTTDGGIHRVQNCVQDTMQWQSLNNGYVVAQFYGIAIDHGTAGSKVVIGGLQDRGTFYTNQGSANFPWWSLRGADGAYCAVEDGGQHYYSSTQYANINRFEINSNGEMVNEHTVMPEGLDGGYLFVHPFTLDPTNNDIMYLPRNGEVWRNEYLPGADVGDLSHWDQISSVNTTITAITASEADPGVVYFGTSNGVIYRLDNAQIATSITPQLVSSGITSAGYTSCIAIDPTNSDRVIAVFSNYNIISLWLTEDAGQTWTPIEGNLKGTPDAGVPPQLSYISNGPSMRWAEIIKTANNGEVVVLGTSIGAFSTRLLNGDSTVWKQEGANTVGNVVVDMIDYRAIDNWVVLGTHGNGIFAANLGIYTPEGITETAIENLKIYPNPTDYVLNIEGVFNGNQTLNIFDLNGKLVRTTKARNQINVIDLPKGQYIIRLSENDRLLKSSKFIKI